MVLITDVNKELTTIDEWMRINKLSLNYNKSKYMLITKKKTISEDLINFKLTIGKHKIEQISQIKYLGITFDDKLTWKSHIQQICSKLSSGSWTILKLRQYVDLLTLTVKLLVVTISPKIFNLKRIKRE